jgi:hypothetical protein
MTVQIRNDQMVELLRPDFQHRAEPNFAWKSACSLHQELLGLRGFWPMSTFDENGDAYDLSGQFRTLTYNAGLYNYPLYSMYDLASFISFDGFTCYLERADEAGLDISGTEAYVYTPFRGLTLGCWAWFDDDGMLTTEHMLSKQNGPLNANSAYALYRTTTDAVRVSVCDGVNKDFVDTAPVASGAWHHFVGRWDPSTELSVFMDRVEYPLGGSVVAAIQNSNANFQIGGRDDGEGSSVYNLDGKIALAFLCAAYLPDPVIFSIYEQTRSLFGV